MIFPINDDDKNADDGKHSSSRQCTIVTANSLQYVNDDDDDNIPVLVLPY